MFLKLTHVATDKRIDIRADHISVILPEGSGARVIMKNQIPYDVKETPRLIRSQSRKMTGYKETESVGEPATQQG